MTTHKGPAAATLDRGNRACHPRPDATHRCQSADRTTPSDRHHRNPRPRSQTVRKPPDRLGPSNVRTIRPRPASTQRPRTTDIHALDRTHRKSRSQRPQWPTSPSPRASTAPPGNRPRQRDRAPSPVRHVRTLTNRQGGFATAELAAALPAIVLLLLTGLFAVNAIATQTRCTDAAREAVLAQARGEDGSTAANRHLPPHAQVDIASTGDTVTAEISAPVRPLGSLLPAMTVTGRATAAREDQETP